MKTSRFFWAATAVLAAGLALDAQQPPQRPASPPGTAATQVGGQWVKGERGERYENGKWIEVTYNRPLLRTPQVQRLGPLFARSISTLGERFLVSAWHDPARVTPEIRANYRKPLRVANWDRALWEFTLASQNQDLGAQLYRLAAPALVVSGEHDRIVPLASSERLAQALRAAAALPADQAVERLIAEADAFAAGAPQHDDLTLLVVRAQEA